MAETGIAICRRSCLMLGAPGIHSFDDGDLGALCGEVYPSLKKSLMARYPWRFLMKKFKLTRDATAPVGEWSYSYVLPPDMIGTVFAVFTSSSDTIGEREFEVFGRRLMCDFADVYVDCAVDLPEDQWPAYFIDLVETAMCARIAKAVTDQQSTMDYWHGVAYGTPSEGGYGGAMGVATTTDAQGSGNQSIYTGDLINVRFGG